MSTLVFVNEFNENWLRGAGSYLDILNRMHKFNGALKGKSIEQAKPLLIDSTILDSIKL